MVLLNLITDLALAHFEIAMSRSHKESEVEYNIGDSGGNSREQTSLVLDMRD